MKVATSRTSYLALLGRPGMAGLLASSLFGRLAAGMVPFGAVAVFAQHRQYVAAGAASAGFLIAASLVAPQRARLIDRYSARRTLPVFAIAFVIVICSSASAIHFNFPIVVPVGLIALAAAVAPPNSMVLRTAWSSISTTDGENRALHSLDSILEEAMFVVSPLLVAAIWVTIGPVWALVAGAVAIAGGTTGVLVFARIAGPAIDGVFSSRQERTPRGEASLPRLRSVMLERKGVALFAPMLGLGIAMGIAGVVFPAWAAQRYNPALSGVIWALISLAGVVGGLVYGKIPSAKNPPWYHYAAMGAIIAIGCGYMALSGAFVAAIVGALVIGFAMTPMFVVAYVLVGNAFEAKRYNVANATLGSAYNLGSGSGALCGGAIVSALGVGPALGLAAIIALMLGALALLGASPTTRGAAPAALLAADADV